MTINIDDNLSKRIISLADEYDRMLDNGANDYSDIGDDCINVVCDLSDLIKSLEKIQHIDKNRFKIYHWEFYVDEADDDYTVYVYETRSGDVMGSLTDTKSLTEVEQFLSQNFSEDDVFNWIDNNIEYI